MFLRIIIPVLNEAENLRQLLPLLTRELGHKGDIIVTDGGSTDDSGRITRAAGCTFFPSPTPGRGPQMNAAVARYPDADIYYFVHADTRPPAGFYRDILQAVGDDFQVGCYRFSFDSRHPLLAINAYCTRFNSLACRGGDQSLFVTRSAFEQLGGFQPDMKIMEDYEFIERAQSHFPFRIIPRDIKVSARKYRANNYFKVQIANLTIFRMYRRGAGQDEMIEKYKSMLNAW